MNPTKQRADLIRASVAFRNLQSTTDRLWAKLAPAGLPEKSRKIGFVAPHTGAGTTTVAASAALGLAHHTRANVLLVEANYRSPRLGHYLQAPPSPGLVAVLSGEAKVETAVQRTDVGGFSVLQSGLGARVTPGFFSTEHAGTVLGELASQYDFMIFDLAPVLESPETRSLLWKLDEACLVVRSGDTRREAAERAIAEIEGSGVKMLGSILNRHRSDLPGWLAKLTAA